MEKFKSLIIENTTYCQANCVVCVRDKISYKLGNMTQQLFEKAVTEVSELYRKKGGKLQFIDLGGMGEPLLDSQIENKLVWLKSYYPDVKVGITTNGQLLMQKKTVLCSYVDVVKISNYGFTKKAFESVHRGSLKFEETKENIENFLKISGKDRPKTIMSYLVLEENKGEEEDWKTYWEGKCEELYIWLPHNWAGYRESHTKQNPAECRSCGRPGRDFVVRANGDISVCCWDFNREMTIGNLNENSFWEIYDGERLKKILDMHEKDAYFDCENICRHCDQLYDRSDALLYSSNKEFKVSLRTTADNV